MAKALYNEVKRLSEAMIEGRLDVRGDTAGLNQEDAKVIPLINSMIDALAAPMMLAGNALDQIAHGNLPPFVIDDYQGEYNKIKQNINTLLAILYGMHGETAHLVSSIGDGKLRTRGNDWDYSGIWKEIISGINQTLDAVIAPIQEAGAVLDLLARYNLNTRMTGKYRGEHAAIRKAMNTTAGALHAAISQVSESVELVAVVGKKISQISSSVSSGAESQSHQLGETSTVLNRLSDSARTSAAKTREAHQNARLATESILTVKESMNRMVESMDRINAAADSTTSIAGEIDEIARETGQLAGSAVEKAAMMRTSAGGFGVVANEIRKLSRQCSTTAKAMKEFESRTGGAHMEGFGELIANLLNVARLSNLLGVNAAIEAAHVEGAGNDFQTLTDEIHRLATRSAEAARKAGTHTMTSVTLANSGVALSNEINQLLEGAVQGAEAIARFAEEISHNFNEQTSELDQISRRAAEITLVTEKNSEGAAESMHVSRELEKQVRKLEKMVHQFTF